MGAVLAAPIGGNRALVNAAGCTPAASTTALAPSTLSAHPMHFSALYAALWFVLAAYWVYAAWGNKKTAHGLNPVWRLLAIAAVAGLAFGFGSHPFGLGRFVPSSPLIQALGLASCAGGVAFAIWARRSLGRNWSGNPTIKEDHELIVSGPYRIVRHPIYSGFLLAAAGTVLGSGKVRDLLFLAVIVTACAAKIRIEESLMMRQFPDAYPEYRRRTKAVIPWIL